MVSLTKQNKRSACFFICLLFSFESKWMDGCRNGQERLTSSQIATSPSINVPPLVSTEGGRLIPDLMTHLFINDNQCFSVSELLADDLTDHGQDALSSFSTSPPSDFFDSLPPQVMDLKSLLNLVFLVIIPIFRFIMRMIHDALRILKRINVGYNPHLSARVVTPTLTNVWNPCSI